MIKTICAYEKGKAVQLTPNFDSSEFDCPCTSPDCRVTLVSLSLVEKAQRMRNQIGPIKVNSGFRCGPHNKELGGAARSYHLLGMAADLKPLVAPVSALVECAEREFPVGGIGKYEGRVHVDERPFTSRWTQVGKE